METFKPIFRIRGRAALLASACLFPALAVTPGSANPEIASQELARRSSSTEEARELLRKGDEAYQAGRYAEAVEAFAGAREMLPDAPVTGALRAAATERYAQASVEQARQLSRKGDVAGAKQTVDKVLLPGVAPNDPGALAFRNQLDDPIRTNPALTAEHAADVDSVRRLLYTAEGAYNLGKFDESRDLYEQALKIDSTNAAARRGLEKVAAAKSDSKKSAFDHTRAEMLSQVDAAWELQVPAPELGLGPEDPGALPMESGQVSVSAKLDRIIIPKIALDQATLEEAIEFLRVATRKADLAGSGAEEVNFTLNLGPADSEVTKRIRSQKFNLQLSEVPLRQVLSYITDITQTSFTTDDFAVVISPAGFTSDELITRTFRVPPDFLTSINAGTAGTATEATDDPFAEETTTGGLLTKRLTAREALEAQGVKFPEGANASYNASTNTLRVLNTASNLDFITQIVDTMNQTEPVIVAVRVTLIKAQENALEELGFDWLVNPFALNGDNTLFASGGTVGNTPGRTGADFISPVGGVSVDGVPADASSLASNLVTNGLRSGDTGITGNSIEELTSNPNGTQRNSVAPGIMALTGLFSDGQVQMIMRGLDQKKGVDVMARPTVLTRSGQQSSVAILREFIYPSEYEPPELPNSVNTDNGFGASSNPVTPATPTGFEMKEVGISLEVLPVADANRRYVDVTLNPSFIEFDGFVNFGSPINSTVQGLLGSETTEVTQNAILMPVFSTQRLNTQLTVADGATIAIGGLMAESIQNVNDKVPVFGDIPFLGRLFSTTAKKPVSTAVVFLVHVELLDPTGRPYRDR
jgi:general secretion pathway protein D